MTLGVLACLLLLRWVAVVESSVQVTVFVHCQEQRSV